MDVKRGDRTIRTFVVFPETKEKAPVVIVIHENKGLTDWVRSVADLLASEGVIAVAPDLLSGTGPGGGGTKEFKSVDDATKAIYSVKAETVMADLTAIAGEARKFPAASGKVAVAGFCWGGGQSFRFATVYPDLAAAFVFYGTPPEKEALSKVSCPVYGFYGGNDARVNATIAPTTQAMKEAGKTYEPVTYEGAGHGFFRAGEEPNASEANKKAHQDAWKRWKALLSKLSAK
jgi:carboxymethylenebutenolidase